MKSLTLLTGLFAVVLMTMGGCKSTSSCSSSKCATKCSQGVNLGYDAGAPLTADEVASILANAEAAAAKEPSLLRVNGEGKQQPTRMHIVVVDRSGSVIGRTSMDDAWGGSVAIAKSKAYTAVAFSSDENALTTRSLGPLTQPGGPLWNIGNSNATDGNPENRTHRVRDLRNALHWHAGQRCDQAGKHRAQQQRQRQQPPFPDFRC